MNKIKKSILLLIVLFLFFSCKSKKTMEFCEGVSTEGAGVKCGETFTTGEMTALINVDNPFTVNKLLINIYKKGKYKSERVESLSADVNPEAFSARLNFYLYEEGDFTIEAIGQDNKKIAEGVIKIVEE